MNSMTFLPKKVVMTSLKRAVVGMSYMFVLSQTVTTVAVILSKLFVAPEDWNKSDGSLPLVTRIEHLLPFLAGFLLAFGLLVAWEHVLRTYFPEARRLVFEPGFPTRATRWIEGILIFFIFTAMFVEQMFFMNVVLHAFDLSNPRGRTQMGLLCLMGAMAGAIGGWALPQFWFRGPKWVKRIP